MLLLAKGKKPTTEKLYCLSFYDNNKYMFKYYIINGFKKKYVFEYFILKVVSGLEKVFSALIKRYVAKFEILKYHLFVPISVLYILCVMY